MNVAIAQASVTFGPSFETFLSSRSQRWHSAVAPGGSGGIVCVMPQSAQVTVMTNGRVREDAHNRGELQERFRSPDAEKSRTGRNI